MVVRPESYINLFIIYKSINKNQTKSEYRSYKNSKIGMFRHVTAELKNLSRENIGGGV